MCPNLVAKRQVLMRSGYALLPCCKWKEVLAELFNYHMRLSMKQIKLIKMYNLQNDQRFEDIVRDIKTILNSNMKIQKDDVTDDISHAVGINNINEMAVYFPPCMYNLYKKLRENHRLPHNSRYQLTVFLKNIGMPYDDAVLFWSDEYIKTSSKNSKCRCSWQKDEKRFIYSIRHMYGLEGRRVNYKTHGCNYLQVRFIIL